MNVAIFGGTRNQLRAPGWKRETVVAAIGGAEFDISDVPPGEGARLTVIAIFGGANIKVAPGTRIRMHGFSLLGGREVRVNPGDGPKLDITAVAVFGGVRVTEAAAS